ncbi:MAG TPA: hypothetical protein PLO24_02075 [Bacteroidales bacterium]|nr:hypothetical protein [Bacteroidales bacterium]HQH22770.1 hypothetical protein [Bacteroidales bacterium]HQJ83560.1 hypothetical protein [Bacteroidales bacterium]
MGRIVERSVVVAIATPNYEKKLSGARKIPVFLALMLKILSYGKREFIMKFYFPVLKVAF